MSRLIIVLALLVSGCSRTYVQEFNPNSPSSGQGSNTGRDIIEYRVTGNATSVRIRYSNSEDGLTQIVTTLPYTFNFTTNAQSLFISLEATPLGYAFAGNVNPFLAAQIFVNGKLFKEATSSDIFLSTLSVSGTWRD